MSFASDQVSKLSAEVAEIPDAAALQAMVESAVESLEGDVTASDLRLQQELLALARTIEETRKEVTALQPEHIQTHDIPTATDELGAVVDAAEEATNVILECAEAIEEVTGSLEGEAAEKLEMAVTRIYEACNFQDITGQRVTKVVNTLRLIEQRVIKLLEVVDPDGRHKETAAAVSSEGTAGATTEADLLNGPATPGEGATQEDIDAILASFD